MEISVRRFDYILPYHFSLSFPQELTHWIKQDIAKINKDIASLQTYVRAQQQVNKSGASSSSNVKQIEEHNNNVVMMLQSKLASTSMGFKEVLEIRTQVRVPKPTRPDKS